MNILSKNRKTGASVNTWTCDPTKLCRFFCYRFRRTKEQARAIEERCGFNPGSNTGPITWPVQQNAYKRNEALIKQMAAEGRTEELAVRLVQQMHHKEEDLRWCGTGDLFPELCELIAYYALFGERRSFGFSRRPEMLIYLRACLLDLEVPKDRWPYFIGSVDESTPYVDIRRLEEGTWACNRGAGALALATWRTNRDLEEYLHRNGQWVESIRVIFGIHSSQHKTKTGHRWACPSTEGENIKCVDCRRCYGEC